MSQLSLLDCTLRDGGYVNNWNFGHAVICGILNKLVSSKVEYIERLFIAEKRRMSGSYAVCGF